MPARLLLVVGTLLPIYFSYLWLLFRSRIGIPASTDRWAKAHRRNARRFVRVAQRMRGGLIKLGQIISTRVDIVPKEWVETLAPLQDQVAPSPWSLVGAHLREELGGDPEEIFASIERDACAAASFGQVHRATTHDGRRVALKIRYPDIRMKLSCDLAALRIAVPFFNLFVPKVRLKDIYEEVGRALETELDYRMEARYTKRIRANLADLEGVFIPRVIDEYSTGSVLCTEFFEGRKVTDKTGLAEDGLDTHPIIERVMHAYTHMFFADGVFQSDPHPGNLLVRADDGAPLVCILDFGQCKILPEGFHEQLVRSAMAFMVRDVDGFSRSIVDMGIMSERDTTMARPLFEEFFGEMFEMSPAELKAMNVDGLKERIKTFIERMEGVVIPQDIVLYGRAFSLLAGVITQLDDEINGFVLARPIIMNTLMKRMASAAQEPAHQSA